MNLDEQELILHTMKGIADNRKRHNDYVDGMLDSMCKELNIYIPERRMNGERRRDYSH